MKIYHCILMIFLILNVAPNANATDTSGYESLQEFCIAKKKDTPENCACGQTTADNMLSPKEQAIALALMQGDRKVLSQLGEEQNAFMDKLSQVTKGCTQQRP